METTNTVKELGMIEEAARFMSEGGSFMWIILLIWVIGIVISIERVRALFGFDCDGPSLMNSVKKDFVLNKVSDAINKCASSNALLPFVLKNGLKRTNQNKDKIKDALEASVLEVVPKAQKRLSILALIANVATLIGLLGTIYGLMESFAAVATADPSQKAKLLALGISKAMNTTAFGLICAISIMFVHSLLTNKSDKIISDVDEYSVKLLDLMTNNNNADSEVIADEAA